MDKSIGLSLGVVSKLYINQLRYMEESRSSMFRDTAVTGDKAARKASE
jgi:hypothetical protein